MFTFLFFESETDAPTPLDVIADTLADLGVVWEAPVGAVYRPGRWYDRATAAQCQIDLGEPPLSAVDSERDQGSTTYSGWRAVALAVHLPLTGPHWQAVECIALVSRLVAALPSLVPLDSEDTRLTPESDSAPFPLDRPRALVSWENQRDAHLEGRIVPRLGRAASVALWRYRKERVKGSQSHPDHHWPLGLVLLDRATGAVHPACLWTGGDLALPPVELVVLRPATDQGKASPVGCLHSDVLVPAALPAPAGAGLVSEALINACLRAGADLLPIDRFAAIDDHDWTD